MAVTGTSVKFNKTTFLKKTLMLILFGLTTFTGYSQNYSDYSYIDKTSYNYYVEGKWDSLIFIANKALENNIDYFYLRSRTGAAYFEKGNYSASAQQFEKAIAFNSSDNFAIESLHNCYINLDRQNDAVYILKKYTSVFSDKTNKGSIQDIYVDAGNNFAKDNNKNKVINPPAGAQWTEADLTNSMLYTGAGLKLCINKNILITTAYTNLKINNTRQILIGNEVLNDNFNLYQNQIYANINYRLAKGATLTPAFHFIMVDYKTLLSNFDTAKNKVMQERKAVAINDYASSISFEKKYSYTGFNLTATFSHLNNNYHKQLGITFNTFPYGNLKLYTISTIVAQSTGTKNNIIAEQTIGIKALNKLWIEAFATKGNIENYTEKNAFVVFNINETITFRTGIATIIPLNKLKITFRYSFLQKTIPYNLFVNDYQKTTFKQNQHFIVATLAYKF